MVIPNMGGTNKKITQGRKKIEIKKIEEVNNRQVTFSKRRSGLFKKASELCVLTGTELAILVHSPGGRVFAFGHPSPDIVIDNYLNNGVLMSNKDHTRTLLRSEPMNEFNQHYSEISNELEKEKKKKLNIEDSNKLNNGTYWWEKPINGLGLEELQQVVPALEEMKKKVLMRAEELMMIRSSSLSSTALVDVKEIPCQVVGFGNYENMMPGFEFGFGKI